jgi:putative endonuclease
MFYVYILESRSHRYIGRTNNLKRRVLEHNAGKNSSTKAYIPWELIFYETYLNNEDAIRRERYLKTSQGRQALAMMLRSHQKAKNFSHERSTTRKKAE